MKRLVINNTNKGSLKSTKFLKRENINLCYRNNEFQRQIKGEELTKINNLVFRLKPLLNSIKEKELGDEDNKQEINLKYHRKKLEFSDLFVKNTHQEEYLKIKDMCMYTDIEYALSEHEVAYKDKYMKPSDIINELDLQKNITILDFELTKNGFLERIKHSRKAGTSLSKYSNHDDVDVNDIVEKNLNATLDQSTVNYRKEYNIDVNTKECLQNISDPEEKNLAYWLFFNRNQNLNFFEYFAQKQENKSLSRNSTIYSSDKLLDNLISYSQIGSIDNSPSEARFLSLFSYLGDYKFHLTKDMTIQPIGKEQAFLDYCYYQNIEQQVSPFISYTTNVETGKKFDLKSYINQVIKKYIVTTHQEYSDPEKVNFKQEYIQKIVKDIIFNDKVSYTENSSDKSIQSLNVDYYSAKNLLDRILNENKPRNNSNINISIRASDSAINSIINNQIKDKVEKTIADVLKNQDKIYKNYIAYEFPFLENTNPLELKILSNKKFVLENEAFNILLNEIVKIDSASKFKLEYQNHLLEDVFINFNSLRKLSLTKDCCDNKHQLGFFYFNGFVIANMYSRPIAGNVECTYKHLDCSRAFNTNIIKDKFECEEDVKELLKLIHIYNYSTPREVDVIKSLHYDL